ncbi:MAG: TetR/AcrR family transcriptional regulator [Myxococcota bacterium]
MEQIQETPSPGRRELNRREKLRSIESAGRDLFTAKGFEETTTRELARAAGVGTGTLFLYFPEKRDLLLHLFQRDVKEVQERAFQSVPVQAPLIEQLGHVFERCFDFYERDLRLSRAFVRELLFTDPEARREHSCEDVFAKEISMLAAAAQERGELRGDLDRCRAALLLMNVYLLGLTGWLLGNLPSRAELDETVRTSLELCFRGLAAPTG